MEFLFLLFGFWLLINGANYVVDSASFIAEHRNVSALIVGFIIVGFCTSAPEFFISFTASLKNQDGLAFGTVIGSNIFNLLIVIGMAGFIRTLHMEKSSIYKEFPFLIFSSIILLILCSDVIFGSNTNNILSRTDGIILLIFFCIFIYSLLRITLKPRSKFILKEQSTSIDLDSYSRSQACAIKSSTSSKANTMLAIGLMGLVFGSVMVVNSATVIADNFGVSNQLIGLTILAIGTSLPEFIIAILAASRGESDIALGNIIASNAFNLLFILGVSSIFSPMVVSSELFLDIIFMILSTIITYIFVLRKKDINKFESISLILIYVIYVLYILSSN